MPAPAVFIDHIDLRVSRLKEAVPLYDALPGAPGMEIFGEFDADQDKWAGWGYRAQGAGPIPQRFFGLEEEAGHRANANRTAFAAASREEVDRITAIAVAASARSVEGPASAPEYGPEYYASFFEDADGNRLEVCCRFQDRGTG